jgi:hypothetical membrane protein
VSGEPAPSEAAVGERRGPLVHRAVHHGAYLLILGAVEFVVAMAVTQWGWNSSAPYGSYSLLHNYISDLGAVNCGAWPSGSTHYVCSPWHLVFNAGIVALGLLLLLGVILIRTGFPARRSSSLGLGFLAIAAVGAIGVGLSPEDVNYYVHAGSAVVAFLFGNLALILLGVAMFRDTRWDGYRAYTMFSGLVGLVALFLYLGHAWGPLGVGGMERLIVAPLLLWAVVAGVHLARVPTYAPTRIHGTST